MKKTKELISAENAEKSKRLELEKAREKVKMLDIEWKAAIEAVNKAQEDADAAMPQCRLVKVSRYSGKEQDAGQMVIERKTKSGILVTRRFGIVSVSNYRFKFSQHSGVFVHAGALCYGTDLFELRDVPTEYLPSDQAG